MPSRANRAFPEPSWHRPLLSASERKAEQVLVPIVEHHGARVIPGFKLSQVIRDRPAGITDGQWAYATRAHFDFVVCDAATLLPDFAIELDDPTHLTADGRRRDRMKDAVCEAAGFELLRIESSALRPGPRGRRLVEYLIDARAYCQDFDEAQEAGHVPFDEPAMYSGVIDRTPDGRLDFVNDLALPARLEAQRAAERGLVQESHIQSLALTWTDGWAEAWAWLRAKDDQFLFHQAGVRSYQFRCGVGPFELAADLAVAGVGADLSGYQRGAPVLVRRRQVDETLRKLQERRSRVDFGGMISDVHLDK